MKETQARSEGESDVPKPHSAWDKSNSSTSDTPNSPTTPKEG